MPELMFNRMYEFEPDDYRPDVGLRLFCWSCRAVHEVRVTDVERLVYGLGAEAEQARAGQGHGESFMDCLLVMVERATTGDCFQFADLSIERRHADGR